MPLCGAEKLRGGLFTFLLKNPKHSNHKTKLILLKSSETGELTKWQIKNPFIKIYFIITLPYGKHPPTYRPSRPHNVSWLK